MVVVHLYDIEGDTFRKVMYLVAGGFVVNLLLPLAWRLRFFVALSLAGIFVVFGLSDGAWMLGLGLVLIAACHLPIPFAARIAVVLALGAGFAALRAGVVATPWTGAIWPILGSMFMFRLALYLRALKTAPAERGVAGTLAYFFMLPNLAFPLFPVIDYQTFHRTSYDKDEAGIYRTGMTWIARGLLHLVLYRLVYYNYLNDPVDVETLGDLAQFMLGTFLLYLRVSGQFHLITGLLHLFGFRLAGDPQALLPRAQLRGAVAPHQHLLDRLHDEDGLLPGVLQGQETEAGDGAGHFDGRRVLRDLAAAFLPVVLAARRLPDDAAGHAVLGFVRHIRGDRRAARAQGRQGQAPQGRLERETRAARGRHLPHLLLPVVVVVGGIHRPVDLDAGSGHGVRLARRRAHPAGLRGGRGLRWP